MDKSNISEKKKLLEFIFTGKCTFEFAQANVWLRFYCKLLNTYIRDNYPVYFRMSPCEYKFMSFFKIYIGDNYPVYSVFILVFF